MPVLIDVSRRFNHFYSFLTIFNNVLVTFLSLDFRGGLLCSPLHAAALHCDTAVLTALLDAKANVDAKAEARTSVTGHITSPLYILYELYIITYYYHFNILFSFF